MHEKVYTRKLAEQENLMLSVRLAPNGRSMHYSLETQDEKVVLGPCLSERALEELCHRVYQLTTKSQSKTFEVLKNKFIKYAMWHETVKEVLPETKGHDIWQWLGFRSESRNE